MSAGSPPAEAPIAISSHSDRSRELRFLDFDVTRPRRVTIVVLPLRSAKASCPRKPWSMASEAVDSFYGLTKFDRARNRWRLKPKATLECGQGHGSPW